MLTALARPWVGVVAAYMFVVLAPQFIWWWAFEGTRPVLWTLVPTLIGIIVLQLRGNLNLARLKTTRNLFLFILWVCFIFSSYAGPYVDVVGSPFRWLPVEMVRGLVNNIFLLYFMAILVIDSAKKLQYLAVIMLVSTVYLTYWINDQYFFQGAVGRIGGPTSVDGSGTYADENIFSMLFVTGLPFLYYFGLYFKRKIFRFGLWLLIPWGWHGVFLTGSRGGLVGLGVTMLIITLRSSKRMIGIGMILLFAVAYQYQAGETMKSRAETITDEQESSTATRLTAWKTAIKMIEDNPLTGVGLASFGVAWLDYSWSKPHEAHNTFFQTAAEAGLIAGIMYLLIVFTTVIDLWKRGSAFRRSNSTYEGNFFYCFNEALLTSFIGLVICSLFLSLQVYEIFYFFCVSSSVLVFLDEEKADRQLEYSYAG